MLRHDNKRSGSVNKQQTEVINQRCQNLPHKKDIVFGECAWVWHHLSNFWTVLLLTEVQIHWNAFSCSVTPSSVSFYDVHISVATQVFKSFYSSHPTLNHLIKHCLYAIKNIISKTDYRENRFVFYPLLVYFHDLKVVGDEIEFLLHWFIDCDLRNQRSVEESWFVFALWRTVLSHSRIYRKPIK